MKSFNLNPIFKNEPAYSDKINEFTSNTFYKTNKVNLEEDDTNTLAKPFNLKDKIKKQLNNIKEKIENLNNSCNKELNNDFKLQEVTKNNSLEIYHEEYAIAELSIKEPNTEKKSAIIASSQKENEELEYGFSDPIVSIYNIPVSGYLEDVGNTIGTSETNTNVDDNNLDAIIGLMESGNTELPTPFSFDSTNTDQSLTVVDINYSKVVDTVQPIHINKLNYTKCKPSLPTTNSKTIHNLKLKNCSSKKNEVSSTKEIRKENNHIKHYSSSIRQLYSSKKKIYDKYLGQSILGNLDTVKEDIELLQDIERKENELIDNLVTQILLNSKQDKLYKKSDFTISDCHKRIRGSLFERLMGKYCPWHLRNNRVENYTTREFRKFSEQEFIRLLGRQEQSRSRKLCLKLEAAKERLIDAILECSNNFLYHKKLRRNHKGNWYLKRSMKNPDAFIVHQNGGGMFYNPTFKLPILGLFRISKEICLKGAIYRAIISDKPHVPVYYTIGFTKRHHIFRTGLNVQHEFNVVSDFIGCTWGFAAQI